MMWCVPPDAFTLHTYLCSRCGNMFEAPAESIDRCRPVRCGACSVVPEPWGDDVVSERLRGITT